DASLRDFTQLAATPRHRSPFQLHRLEEPETARDSTELNSQRSSAVPGTCGHMAGHKAATAAAPRCGAASIFSRVRPRWRWFRPARREWRPFVCEESAAPALW